MHIAITSTIGNPSLPTTWSSAPYNLSNALNNNWATQSPINSSILYVFDQIIIAYKNIMMGQPTEDISRFPRGPQKISDLSHDEGTALCD